MNMAELEEDMDRIAKESNARLDEAFRAIGEQAADLDKLLESLKGDGGELDEAFRAIGEQAADLDKLLESLKGDGGELDRMMAAIDEQAARFNEFMNLWPSFQSDPEWRVRDSYGSEPMKGL